jgi:ribonucleotide monophosphatase NagD (HAD superfamily)
MKPKTYLIDIDGTLFLHLGEGATIQWSAYPIVLPGVHEFLDQIEAEGAHIVLVTARPECCRAKLVEHLAKENIYYHQLLMGVTSGQRVLINDAKPGRADRSAVSVVVERNAGLGDLIRKPTHE